MGAGTGGGWSLAPRALSPGSWLAPHCSDRLVGAIHRGPAEKASKGDIETGKADPGAVVSGEGSPDLSM